MKKIADFIVDKRAAVLAAMLLPAVACVVFTFMVHVNSDMTKYLPDDSSMKIGLDIMEDEFPETEENYTIRVMFDDLSGAQKADVKTALEKIEYVGSVDYDADDNTYNKENHTLYVVNTRFDYGTKEETSIEKALENDFSAYAMSFQNDDIGMEEIPLWIIASALVILMAILFIMCNSWIEPFLFLASIGVAVVLNMGTNIFMGEISEITFAIAAILQLVLSMDYSIILLNRYRQELPLADNKFDAMKNALTNAFSSIAGSSVTTVVGLLALVFMSFKIGADFGIVLAKGVFLSMLSTFTVLPGLILISDKLISKTAKKSLQIKTGALAAFSYKFRYVITSVFALLFVGVFFLKGSTDIVYTLDKNDKIADIFPPSNTIVMIYENIDDTAVTEIAETLENDEKIENISNYTLTLGKEYTASELSGNLEDFGGNMDIDPSLLGIIYYDYYIKEDTAVIKASDFINFIVSEVMENPAFTEYFDDSVKNNIDTMKKFADPQRLTRKMNAAELGEFLGFSADDAKGLLLLYYTKNGGVDTGSVTLPEFADFMIKEVAENEDYAAMFNEDALSKIEMLTAFTDKTKMTVEQNIGDISKMLDMDENTIKMLFVYYYSLSESYNPNDITIPALVHFITNDVAANPMFSSQFDQNTLSQINMMAGFTDKNAVQQEMSAEQLAGALSMDASMVNQIFGMRYGTDITGKTMSMEAFTDFLLQTANNNQEFAAYFDATVLGRLTLMQTIMKSSINGTAYDYTQMSALLGMDSGTAKMLYTFYTASYGDTSAWKLSMQTIINFIADNSAQFGSLMDNGALAELKTGQKLINGSVAGTSYASEQMASLIGMDEKQLEQLYLLYASEHNGATDWGLSVQNFVGFIISDVLGNEGYSDKFDADTTDGLKTAETFIDAVVSGKSYNAEELAEMFGGLSAQIDEDTMDLMFLYYSSVKNSDAERKLSITSLFNYLSEDLVNDPRYDAFLDDTLRSDLDDMKTKLDEGAAQLRGEKYARLILNTTYPGESDETMSFLENLTAQCGDRLNGDFYLIGNSAMNFEMMNSFDDEMNFITLLTAIAIFIVILLTFRSFSVPAVLVLVIQCGVYLTVSIIGVQGYSIFYLALLIVQCILMGATIDYGILFTSYYREKRQSAGIKEALEEAYHGAIHTILTSGLIMILITGILGYCFANPTIGQICQTISKGAMCATILILFVLPGILAALDKLVCGKKAKQ